MTQPTRMSIHRVLATFALGLCVMFGSSPAFAQNDVKRSAGTMKRSAGERKGATASSGQSSGMSSRRSSTRSTPRLPSEDDYDEKKDESYWDSSKSSSYDDEDDDFEPDSAPTLGRACIYGPNDKVVFRPAGSWCRGDAPIEPEPGEADRTKLSSDARESARRAAPAAAASAYRSPEVRRKKKVKRKTSAGCLYGKDGEVLFAPETSDCINGIGAPPRP